MNELIEKVRLSRLLDILNESPDQSQRFLAQEVGLSLGLVNLWLKRLAESGYIRIENSGKRKMLYVVTPQGLEEKMKAFEWLMGYLKDKKVHSKRV